MMENYEYKSKKISLAESVDLIKNIYFIATSITVLLVIFFGIEDFLLFINKFGFSIATFKDFYLTSFDFGMSSILIYFTLFPVIIALLFFYVPYIIVELIPEKVGIEKVATDWYFYAVFFLLYFIFGSVVFFMLDSFVNEILIMILVYISNLILSLYCSTFISKFVSESNRKKIAVVIITTLIILFIVSPLIKIILLLLFLLLFIPMIIMMFLSVKIDVKEEKKTLPTWVKKGALLLVFMGIGIIYNFNILNASIWNKPQDQNTTLNNFTLNLVLNKIFLIQNRQQIDINISNYYNMSNCIYNAKQLSLNKDDNITVLSLSEKRKLFFKEYNKLCTCIYAVKIINVKGKNIYKLMDIGHMKYIKKDK